MDVVVSFRHVIATEIIEEGAEATALPIPVRDDEHSLRVPQGLEVGRVRFLTLSEKKL